MTIRALFPTLLHQSRIEDDTFLAVLAQSCRVLAAEDRAGRAWSKAKGYRGYTSYASLNDLPRRDPVFADLVKRLAKPVARLAEACAFDLAGRKPRLDSLWVNVLRPGGAHSVHLHPHSIISGTLYVAVPPGAGAIRFEDPRLPLYMAAPPRREDAEENVRPFVTVAPEPGTVLLWESWLRHEVLPSSAREDRVSVSFNYRW
ncbi:MAG: hypothetical protein A4S16_01210 [Proteobacteria bacterium SG_bin6]|nr:MAG: hypothetical protein A4S16_01210 [Proteobacteria bacterium SG_bin6]